MSKIKKVECYWYNSGVNNGNWVGKILVDDDGWFEGIVVDSDSACLEHRFVFGVYHEDRVIDLFKLAPISLSNPLRFFGNKENGTYDGEFSVIAENGEFLYGDFRIMTTSLNIFMENEEGEREYLKSSIEQWKSSIMDDACKQLYQNILSIRNIMTEITLKNHEGRGFNLEEVQRILNEFQPDAIIIGEQNEFIKGKNLIKRFSNIELEEVDLPFK